MISFDPPYNKIYRQIRVHPADQMTLMVDYTTTFLNLLSRLDYLKTDRIPYEDLANGVASTLTDNGYIGVNYLDGDMYLTFSHNAKPYRLKCIQGTQSMTLQRLADEAGNDRKKINLDDIPVYDRLIILTRFGMAFGQCLINSHTIKPDLPGTVFPVAAAQSISDGEIDLQPDGDKYHLLFNCNKQPFRLTLSTVIENKPMQLSIERVH